MPEMLLNQGKQIKAQFAHTYVKDLQITLSIVLSCFFVLVREISWSLFKW